MASLVTYKRDLGFFISTLGREINTPYQRDRDHEENESRAKRGRQHTHQEVGVNWGIVFGRGIGNTRVLFNIYFVNI